MTITFADAVDILRHEHPLLDQTWNRVSKEWEPERPPITYVFGEFALVISDLVATEPEVVARVMDLVELLLSQGDSEASEAARTGFLEVLSNHEGTGEWRSYLRPESAELVEGYERFWLTGNPNP